MSLHFKWFLTLSVAAHAAVMFAWVAPLPDTGSPGLVLLLDITEQAGQSTHPAATDAASGPRPPDTPTAEPAPPHKPASAGRRATGQQPLRASTDPADTRRSEPGDADNTKPGRADALAAHSPRPSHEESDRHLRDSVLRLVTQRLHYPAIARRKGWQGVVTLKLHIEPDGLISDLQVNETSGYPALDHAAVKSLQLASIPGAGAWLHGRSIDMLVPVEYRLLDS